jgi:hypothetical protein
VCEAPPLDFLWRRHITSGLPLAMDAELDDLQRKKKLRRPLPSVPNVSNTKIWRSTGPSLKDLLGACCHSFPSWDLEDIS